MPRYEILTDATTIDVRFKPSLPGVGVRVSGLSGSFQAELTPDDEISFADGVEGEFHAGVDEIDVGNRVVTYIARKWLAGRSDLAVRGTVASVRGRGGRSFEAAIRTTLHGVDYDMTATGSMSPRADGQIEVEGTTILHPSEVGVPMPRWAPPMVHVHWHILMSPET